MQNAFKIEISNNKFIIMNTSGISYYKLFLSVKNTFYQEIIGEFLSLESGERKEFSILNNNFKPNWINEDYQVDILSNNKKIYYSVISPKRNIKNRSIVLISDKKFELLTSCLIEGLLKYSSNFIYHYTINYNSQIKHPRIENRFFSVTQNELNNGHDSILLIKPKILLQSLIDGLDSAIFLDSDIVVKKNIPNLLNYSYSDSKQLILQKSAWDYVLLNDMYIPGPKVRQLLGLGVPEAHPQPQPHGMTNIILYNSSHKDLFQEWHSICTSEEIRKIKTEEYLHDELLLNCVLWKNKLNTNFIYPALNIKDEKDVIFYYNFYDSNNQEFFDMNSLNLGHKFQSYIPRDKNNISAFHCVKDYNTAKKINNIIFEEEVVKKTNPELYFKNKLIHFYNSFESDTSSRKILEPKKDVSIILHYVDGPYVELRGGDQNKTYKVEFIDQDQNRLIYPSEIKTNHWTRANIKYFINWKIKIWDENNLILEENINLKNSNVLISFDSNSLGDNIAWMPYVEAFRQKHECNITVSTFYNNLFKKSYPTLNFIEPGGLIHNIKASYLIGCFDLTNRINCSGPWNEIPLQKVASDILGLDYEEIRTKIDCGMHDREINQPYICIATESTAQCKYWNYPNGWEKLASYLVNLGYKVVNVSLNPPKITNITNVNIKTLEDVQKYLLHCEFFVGLPSGVSWLAWGMNKKVAMISGFSYPWCEFTDKININPENNICQGCFNWKQQIFDKTWEFCPKHKNTSDEYICTKSITPEQVLEKIQPLLQ